MFTSALKHLLRGLICRDVDKRLSSSECLDHPWFDPQPPPPVQQQLPPQAQFSGAPVLRSQLSSSSSHMPFSLGSMPGQEGGFGMMGQQDRANVTADQSQPTGAERAATVSFGAPAGADTSQFQGAKVPGLQPGNQPQSFAPGPQAFPIGLVRAGPQGFAPGFDPSPLNPAPEREMPLFTSAERARGDPGLSTTPPEMDVYRFEGQCVRGTETVPRRQQAPVASLEICQSTENGPHFRGGDPHFRGADAYRGPEMLGDAGSYGLVMPSRQMRGPAGASLGGYGPGGEEAASSFGGYGAPGPGNDPLFVHMNHGLQATNIEQTCKRQGSNSLPNR